MSIIDETTAQAEVLILEFNAIVRLIHSKKFKALITTNQEAYFNRLDVYETRQFELSKQISELINSIGGKAKIWSGVL